MGRERTRSNASLPTHSTDLANPRKHFRVRALVQNLDPVFLDDRVGEDLVGDGLDLFVGFLASDAIRNRDVENFALAHIGDGAMAEAAEGGADRLALRVEDRGFEGNENASFHGSPIIAWFAWLAGLCGAVTKLGLLSKDVPLDLRRFPAAGNISVKYLILLIGNSHGALHRPLDNMPPVTA